MEQGYGSGVTVGVTIGRLDPVEGELETYQCVME